MLDLAASSPHLETGRLLNTVAGAFQIARLVFGNRNASTEGFDCLQIKPDLLGSKPGNRT
jgi:hypothetical protein